MLLSPQIISGHPPVLSYRREQLEAFWQYLVSLGIQDVTAVLIKRCVAGLLGEA